MCTPAFRAVLQDILLCHSFHFSFEESQQPHPPKPLTGLQRALVLFLHSFPNADSELKSVKEANKKTALHAMDCTALKNDFALVTEAYAIILFKPIIQTLGQTLSLFFFVERLTRFPN